MLKYKGATFMLQDDLSIYTAIKKIHDVDPLFSFSPFATWFCMEEGTRANESSFDKEHCQ
jgi:hypothetical protein